MLCLLNGCGFECDVALFGSEKEVEPDRAAVTMRRNLTSAPLYIVKRKREKEKALCTSSLIMIII